MIKNRVILSNSELELFVLYVYSIDYEFNTLITRRLPGRHIVVNTWAGVVGIHLIIRKMNIYVDKVYLETRKKM